MHAVFDCAWLPVVSYDLVWLRATYRMNVYTWFSVFECSIEKLGWKTIDELIDIESKTMVFKSLNELAPPYLRILFRKNSQSTSYRLRNTSTDLSLPKKAQKTARNAFRLGVRNFGTASQLTANKQPP